MLPYLRFGLMILTSTFVMFVLMYLNTYAWEHISFSETRAYMAIMMGVTMAFIMLAYMLGMYPNNGLNIAIFVAAVIVFALSLWLVRSQVTVSGTSYMRAMIPHHSIAIMTSERAQIDDARVRKMADEIVEAQRREIAEMQFLIDQVSDGVVENIYDDPPAELGSIQDALSNTLISQLDLAPMTADDADKVLEFVPSCKFSRSEESEPIFWVNADRNAGIKLNGVLVVLGSVAEPQVGPATFAAPGTTVTVRPLADGAALPADAELVFEFDAGLRVGYRGLYICDEI